MSPSQRSHVPLVVLASEAADSVNQDRAYVVDAGSARIALVADGAGGANGAAAATDAVVSALLSIDPERDAILDPARWVEWLQRVDRSIREDREAGESTAVVAVIAADRVLGASVGDSTANLYGPGTVTDLTRLQHRKPLLGGPGATPVPFGPVPFRGTLVLATDGLHEHAPSAQVADVARTTDALADVPAALIHLVRGRAGTLPDDVSVIAARPGSPA